MADSRSEGQQIIGLPRLFVESYSKYREYPLNLLPNYASEQLDPEVFQSYRSQLSKRSRSDSPLFLPDPTAPSQTRRRTQIDQSQGLLDGAEWTDDGAWPKIYLLARDILDDGSVQSHEIRNDTGLRNLLGHGTTDVIEAPEATSIVGSHGTSAAASAGEGHCTSQNSVPTDPLCRFVFLKTKGMTRPLLLTEHMLCRLLTFHQVTPCYLDFLFCYSTMISQDQTIRYSGFRSEIITSDPHPANIAPGALGRSGYRYQICYNIKNVTELEREGVSTLKWKHRQATIYHHFDINTRRQVWIVGDPCISIPLEAIEAPQVMLSDRVGDLYKTDDDHSAQFESHHRAFLSSVNIHLVFMRGYAKDWRIFIRRVEQNIETETSDYLSLRDPRVKSPTRFTTLHLSRIQDMQRRVSNAVTVLESNERTSMSLRKFYTTNIHEIVTSKEERLLCIKINRRFVSQLEELIYETQMQVKHLRLLNELCLSREKLLVKHLDAQATAEIEALNSSLWVLTNEADNKARVMRIITGITVAFLPPTVVSAFFSCGIITYVAPDSAASGSPPTPSQSQGSIRLNDEMFDQWLKWSGILWVIMLGSALVWYLLEQFLFNRRRKTTLEEEAPDTFQRIKKFN